MLARVNISGVPADVRLRFPYLIIHRLKLICIGGAHGGGALGNLRQELIVIGGRRLGKGRFLGGTLSRGLVDLRRGSFWSQRGRLLLRNLLSRLSRRLDC